MIVPSWSHNFLDLTFLQRIIEGYWLVLDRTGLHNLLAQLENVIIERYSIS